MKITIPLPPAELSPNSRCHWRVKAKATAAMRAISNSRTQFNLPDNHKPFKSATIQATFYFRDKRRRDKDNMLASLKSAFDGLADAGLVADDSDFTHLPVVVCVDRVHPRVELEVTNNA